MNKNNLNNVYLKIFMDYEVNSWFNVHQINREQFTSTTPNPQIRHSHGQMQMHGLTMFLNLRF